jgi:4-hydroxybenzoate polyprenyltransferase
MFQDRVVPDLLGGWRTAVRQFAQFSNLHILLVAAGLTAGSAVLIGQPLSGSLLAASCSGAFLIYLIDRALLFRKEDSINQPDRVAWYARHPAYTSGAFLAALGVLCLAAFDLTLPVLVWGGCMGAGGVVYLLDFGRRGSRFKGHWLIKPLAIAGAWTAGTVFFPAYGNDAWLEFDVAFMALYRFTFILPNVILADWPDRDGDAAADLKPLAVIRGQTGVRRWATGLAFLSLLLGMSQAVVFAWPAHWWIDLGGPALMIYAAQRSFSGSHWFYGFVIDLMVAWPLVTAFVEGSVP